MNLKRWGKVDRDIYPLTESDNIANGYLEKQASNLVAIVEEEKATEIIITD